MRDTSPVAEAAREALERRSVFNIVDQETGWKADVNIRKARPFSEEEFRRRRPAYFFGVPFAATSVEDRVIAKLERVKLGESARQVEGVGELLRVAGNDIDQAHLRRWIEARGLEERWAAAGGTGSPSRGAGATV